MIWFLGFGLLVANYGIEWYTYFFARVHDEGRQSWGRPYWEYATLTWLVPSADPKAERHRRASILALCVAIVWLVVGVPLGGAADRLAEQAGSVSAVLGTAVVIGTLIALLAGARFAMRVGRPPMTLGSSDIHRR